MKKKKDFYVIREFCLHSIVTPKNHLFAFRRLEEFLVPELQATEEEKSKLESGLTNGDEPMDQDLSVLPTKCISSMENLEIRSVIPLCEGLQAHSSWFAAAAAHFGDLIRLFCHCTRKGDNCEPSRKYSWPKIVVIYSLIAAFCDFLYFM